MADTLSAASLLLTAIAIIYSLWYPEMTAALKIVPETHKADNRRAFAHVGDVVRTRAVPLLLISFFLTTIFIPDTAVILRASIQHAANKHLVAVMDYSPVATALVAVTVLLGLLTAHLGLLTHRLIQLRGKLSPV